MHDDPICEMSPRFLAYWQGLGRVLIDGEALWEPLKQARGAGDLTDRMNPREVLMGVLGHLGRTDAVRLPVSKSGWDRSVLPHVPRWIRLLGGTKPKPSREWQAWVLHDLLMPAVAGRKSLSQAQQNLLARLDDLLKREGRLKPAGKRSRSLALTGDEKALDDLMETHAIRAIGAEALNVVDFPAPLTTVRIGEGKAILILENQEPFYAALEGLSGAPGPFGAVAYGRGGEIADSIRSLRWVMPGVRVAVYVGDLDRMGMTIMRRAQAAGALIGVRVVPATPLYREMVRRSGSMGYPDGWPSVRANKDAEFSLDQLLEGFEEDIRAFLDRLWENDRRIPEEALESESFQNLTLVGVPDLDD